MLSRQINDNYVRKVTYPKKDPVGATVVRADPTPHIQRCQLQHTLHRFHHSIGIHLSHIPTGGNACTTSLTASEEGKDLSDLSERNFSSSFPFLHTLQPTTRDTSLVLCLKHSPCFAPPPKKVAVSLCTTQKRGKKGKEMHNSKNERREEIGTSFRFWETTFHSFPLIAQTTTS